MEVRVNGASFAVIMRTPGADRDLAAGFLLAEDVIRSADEIGTIEYCRQDVDRRRPRQHPQRDGDRRGGRAAGGRLGDRRR